MKTIVMVVAFLGFTLGIIATQPFSAPGAVGKAGQAAKPMNHSGNGLEVSVIPDKPTYRPNEKIKLQTMLTNSSADTIYIYGILSWGYSASLNLYVTDAAGKEVEAKIFDDSVTPPPPPNDQRAFVRLYPQHFLGTYYYSSIDELNLDKPGRYSLFVEYHCPLSGASVELNPFWGKEKGVIRSKVAFIEVVQK